MISEKMVSQVKEKAGVLAERFLAELVKREETRCYRNLNRDTLYKRIFGVFDNLDAWLAGNRKNDDMQKYFAAVARQHLYEGIPLDEMLMAFMLIKRQLWLYVQEQNFFDSTFVCNQALEFNNRVVLFFDKASYFSAKGYLEEMKNVKLDKQIKKEKEI